MMAGKLRSLAALAAVLAALSCCVQSGAATSQSLVQSQSQSQRRRRQEEVAKKVLSAGRASASLRWVTENRSCLALPPLRSAYVQEHFDVRGMAGQWFEQAYKDPAQVLSTCQRLVVNESAIDAATGCFNVSFDVLYADKTIPFAILEIYEPVKNSSTGKPERGLFLKHVDHPPPIHLPTAVMEVVPSASSTKAAPSYEAFVLYSCLDVFGAAINEVVIATLDRNPPKAMVGGMIKRAAALGWTGDLTFNTWADCPAYPPLSK